MFFKVRFKGSKGATAGLIVNSERLKSMSVTELSQMFPVTEARYMQRVEVSPPFDSWDRAFLYSFENGEPPPEQPWKACGPRIYGAKGNLVADLGVGNDGLAAFLTALINQRPLSTDDFKELRNGYIEAIYFTEAGPDGDIPMDAQLSAAARERIDRDCAEFLIVNYPACSEAVCFHGYSASCLGQDFWLSRNGHGSGFFDRDQLTQELRDALDEAAKKAGQCEAYLSDAGEIELS